MRALDPIDEVESALARLMPPALSQDCQCELEALIDDLAGAEPANVVQISKVGWAARIALGGGIAAAIGALVAVFPGGDSVTVPVAAHESPSGWVLVSESDRLESMTDEGWKEDANGSAIHAVRLNLVGENRLRDEETGMVVRISEPREEMLLMPISSF